MAVGGGTGDLGGLGGTTEREIGKAVFLKLGNSGKDQSGMYTFFGICFFHGYHPMLILLTSIAQKFRKSNIFQKK